MFKDEYKKDNELIKPDKAVIDRIKWQMQLEAKQEQERKPENIHLKHNRIIKLVSGIAAAAVIVAAVNLMPMPWNSFSKNDILSSEGDLVGQNAMEPNNDAENSPNGQQPHDGNEDSIKPDSPHDDVPYENTGDGEMPSVTTPADDTPSAEGNTTSNQQGELSEKDMSLNVTEITVNGNTYPLYEQEREPFEHLIDANISYIAKDYIELTADNIDADRIQLHANDIVVILYEDHRENYFITAGTYDNIMEAYGISNEDSIS